MSSKNPSLLVICLFAAACPASSRTLQVGPERTYKLPSAAAAAAQNGDTILIDAGTYSGDEAVWRADNLVIRGTARWAHITAPATLENAKAIFVVHGTRTLIENIRFSGAKVPSLNGAGIRQHGNHLTVRNCWFHDNENGILGGGDASSEVLIESSEFAGNGAGDGYSHNMYISSVKSFTLKFSNTHHAKVGHNIKSRAATNYILYNRIMDEAEGTASYEIDLPNGGLSYVIGNVIQQGPATGNAVILSFGAEGVTHEGSTLTVINNTFVNDRQQGGTFVRVAAAASPARIVNNLFVGTGSVLSGPGDTSGNLAGNDVGLRDRAGYDYRLLPSSPAINKGIDPGVSGTFPLLPAFHYSPLPGGEKRSIVGRPDMGAFEFLPASPVRSGAFRPPPAQSPNSFSGRGLIGFRLPARLAPSGYRPSYTAKGCWIP